MATRDMVAALVLRLRDQVSGGLARLQARLAGLRQVAQRLAGIALLGAGFALGPAIAQAAAFEGQLRDIAITAGNTGQAVGRAVDDMRRQLAGLAGTRAESSRELAGGLEALTARGLDPAQIQRLLPVLADVRSASGAASEQLAQLIVAFDRVAGIRDAAGVERALAAALRAGQLGGVELRDMARYLPGILAQMSTLQVTGQAAVVDAAALFQVIRDGTGTTEEAAAAFQQLLGQLLSRDTVKRAEEMFGIDLRAVFRRAVEGGFDPVLALVGKLREALAGDPSRASEFIADQNARQALLALIAGYERVLDLRRQVAEATPEVIAQAAGDRQQGLAADVRRAQEQWAQLTDQLGLLGGRALPVLTAGLAEANRLLDIGAGYLARLDEIMPRQVDRWVELGVQFGAAATAIGLVTTALRLMLVALGPVGIAVAALGAAATLIITNWTQVRDFFAGLWQDIAGGFDRHVRPLLDRLERFFEAERAPPRTPEVQQQQRGNFRDRGRLGGFPDPVQPQSAPAGAPEIRGAIQIALAPGLVLRRAESETPGVSFSAGPDRGLMLRGI